MEKKEHIKIVKEKGVATWNRAWIQWRRRHSDDKPYLRRAALSGHNLAGSKFAEADLRDADLGGANLQRAELRVADLSGAVLTGADLTDADLCGAKLEGADLRRAVLRRTALAGADLKNAKLGETFLVDLSLHKTKNLHLCIHRGPSILDQRSISAASGLPRQFLEECGLTSMMIDVLPKLTASIDANPRCFISYSHSDASFAQRLRDRLRTEGFPVWMDEYGMVPGDDIAGKIENAISQSDKVLLCCSEMALNSGWVELEIERALQEEQARTQKSKESPDNGNAAPIKVLLPLALDDSIFVSAKQGKVKQDILNRLVADFRSWNTDKKIFKNSCKKVVKALRRPSPGKGKGE